MSLNNNNRQQERADRKLLRKFAKDRRKVKDASDLEVESVESPSVSVEPINEEPPTGVQRVGDAGAFVVGTYDDEARSEDIIRRVSGLPAGAEIDEASRLKAEDLLINNQMDLFRERIETATNELPPVPLASVDMRNVPINQEAVDSNNAFFRELAEAEPLSAYDEARLGLTRALGDEPTLDEKRLKRFKTQALVNAFGNILKGGLGIASMQSGGTYTPKPTDDSGILANLEGVYDDYYKEMRDYRDRSAKTQLGLAELNLQEMKDKEASLRREQDREDAMRREEFEREKFDYTKEKDANLLELRREESERNYELNKQKVDQAYARLNLDQARLDELQLQNDREYARLNIKGDRDRELAYEKLNLERIQLDELIRRNDNSEITNGIKLASDGFESLQDAFPSVDYVSAMTTANTYVMVDGELKDLNGNKATEQEKIDYDVANKYISEYDKLINTQNQLIERLKLEKNKNQGVDISNPSEVDINDTEVMKSLSGEVVKAFENTSPEFTAKVFGEGKGQGGGLNATNIDFAINYFENKDNFFDIVQAFGWSDDEAEKNRQDIVVKLEILKRSAESINE